MLSDPSLSTFSFDVPVLPSTRTPLSEEDPFAPLNFDDLLDIAREFEFTRTITDVWPCEEEPGACSETRLDDILAVIVPTPNAGEYPTPLPSSAPMTVNPVHVQQVGSHRPASVDPAPNTNAYISTDPVPLPRNDDQVRAQTGLPIASALQGWSPPDGSQFLDLDDSLMLSQPAKDMWNPPRLAMFLATSPTQPGGDINQSFATVSTISDVQPQMLATLLKPPPVSTTDKTADDPRKNSVPTPVQPSTRAVLEPVQARSAAQTTSNVPSQTVITAHAKPPKPRPHLPSTPATGGTTNVNYGRAPRGGIPPHIARSVTKANILRVEKERKVMQDAFSSTITRDTKKPSVLRRAAKVERETSKNVNGDSSGKNLFGLGENDEKEQRAAKRVRV